MLPKDKIIDELGFLTDKISTQVRTVALGVLALAWGLLIGGPATPPVATKSLKSQLVAIGASAILTMFLDFLQYVAGYVNTIGLLIWMEKNKLDKGEYDYESMSYRLRRILFRTKCWLLAGTVIWLLAVLAWWLVSQSSSPGASPVGVPPFRT